MDAVPSDAQIGFVGLGNLGQPMARALLSGGWDVAVLDTAPDKAQPCVEHGARAATTPLDLAGCAVVALAVPDDAAANAVLCGSDGTPGLLAALDRDAIVLIHSTILPDTARRLAERAHDHGVDLLDAPVSGGADRALAGELTVMVGGEAAVLARARPVLETVGADVRHVGPPGAGAAVKLANQLMMFSALAGAHEALDLARAYGVDESAVLGAVASSTGDSWVSRHWGFFDEVARAYDAGSTPVPDRPWSKDLWDVVAAARAADVPVPVAALLAQVLAARVESHARGGHDADEA
jgi:3-hydroxyisobutyrate dehydrogenase-like beta-hydroxyacid dehydrogenase